LTFRSEEKIILNKQEVALLKAEFLKKKIKTLYPIREINSIYFDTDDLKLYQDSEEGTLPRKKIRIRNYPFSKNNLFFLETKISSVEGRYKISVNLNKNLKNNYLESGILDAQYGILKKKILINYKREYYFFNDVRFTLDYDIKYSTLTGAQFYFEKFIIFEIKSSFNYDHQLIQNIISLTRYRFSKYNQAIKACIKK
jgi:hypothetical protein